MLKHEKNRWKNINRSPSPHCESPSGGSRSIRTQPTSDDFMSISFHQETSATASRLPMGFSACFCSCKAWPRQFLRWRRGRGAAEECAPKRSQAWDTKARSVKHVMEIHWHPIYENERKQMKTIGIQWNIMKYNEIRAPRPLHHQLARCGSRRPIPSSHISRHHTGSGHAAPGRPPTASAPSARKLFILRLKSLTFYYNVLNYLIWVITLNNSITV